MVDAPASHASPKPGGGARGARLGGSDGFLRTTAAASVVSVDEDADADAPGVDAFEAVAGGLGAASDVSASRLAAADTSALGALTRISIGFNASNSMNLGALAGISDSASPRAAARVA